jgi:hypothetical protein
MLGMVLPYHHLVITLSYLKSTYLSENSTTHVPFHIFRDRTLPYLYIESSRDTILIIRRSTIDNQIKSHS